mmetsp:Transcript_2421/g.4836  ORF Transcript_2421/g.4836 Transcript_2421/m.4836 type:complete len:624 (-) Transcript_2421:665-2536(-)
MPNSQHEGRPFPHSLLGLLLLLEGLPIHVQVLLRLPQAREGPEERFRQGLDHEVDEGEPGLGSRRRIPETDHVLRDREAKEALLLRLHAELSDDPIGPFHRDRWRHHRVPDVRRMHQELHEELALVGLDLLLQLEVLHQPDVVAVVHHVRRQDAGDDAPPRDGKGLLGEAPEDIAILGTAALLSDLKHPRTVVVLQGRAVVVPDSELALRHHFEGVTEPPVADVVAQCAHDRGEHVNRGEEPGDVRRAHELVGVVHRRYGVVEVVVRDRAVGAPHRLEEVDEDRLPDQKFGGRVLFCQDLRQQAELLIQRQSPVVDVPAAGVCTLPLFGRDPAWRRRLLRRRLPRRESVHPGHPHRLGALLFVSEVYAQRCCHHRPLVVVRVRRPLLLVVLGHHDVQILLPCSAHLRLRQHHVYNEELQVASHGLRQRLQQLAVRGREARGQRQVALRQVVPGAVLLGQAPVGLGRVSLVQDLQHAQQPSLRAARHHRSRHHVVDLQVRQGPLPERGLRRVVGDEHHVHLVRILDRHLGNVSHHALAVRKPEAVGPRGGGGRPDLLLPVVHEEERAALAVERGDDLRLEQLRHLRHRLRRGDPRDDRRHALPPPLDLQHVHQGLADAQHGAQD